MNDPSPEPSLSGYFDGELEPSDQVDLARRLEQSLAARNELSEIKQLSNFLQELPTQKAPANLLPQVLKQIDGEQARATESRQPASGSRHTAVQVVSLLATAAGLTVMLRPPALRNQPLPGPPGRSQAATADASMAMSEASSQALVNQAESGIDVPSLLQACQSAGRDVVVVEATVADLPAAMRAVAAWQIPLATGSSAKGLASTQPARPAAAGGWSSGIYLQAQPAELSHVLHTIAANPVWQQMNVRGVVDVASLQSDGLDLTRSSLNRRPRERNRSTPLPDDDASAATADGLPAKPPEGGQLKYIPVRVNSFRFAEAAQPPAAAEPSGSRAPQPVAEAAALPARRKILSQPPVKLRKDDASSSAVGGVLRVVLILRTPSNDLSPGKSSPDKSSPDKSSPDKSAPAGSARPKR